MMNRTILGVLLLAVACDTPTVPERLFRDVYDFELLTPQPKVMRWPSGTTVKVYIVPDADPNLAGFLRAAVTHAEGVWNTTALYGEVKVEQTSTLDDADVLVMYSLSTSPLDLSGCAPSGGFAVTTFCLTEDRLHLRAFPLASGGASNVKFVVTVRTNVATDAATVRRFVTHEVGHALGLAQHSPNPNDLMFGGSLSRDVVNAADRATLQVLYHTRVDITP